MILWMLNNSKVNGLFNVGTGQAQSFSELAKATFSAMNKEINIEYIDMPEHLKEKYQYYTEASIAKLRSVGYNDEFRNIEEGARDYIELHLSRNMIVY